MALIEVEGPEGLQGLVEQEIGPSEWITVSQEMINRFADLSGDDQWIHTDPARAERESPYGTTIAHGNLTLALIDGLRSRLVKILGVEAAVNYGWDRVRFPAPVPSGARVRARSQLRSCEQLDGGWWQVVTRLTVEVEGSEKPACVADSVGRIRFAKA